MIDTPTMTTGEEWYRNALATLNQISESVNRVRAGDPSCLTETLNLVADAAVRLLGASWVAIVPYDPEKKDFDQAAGITAGAPAGQVLFEFPESLASISIRERTPFFSDERPTGFHFFESRLTVCYPLITDQTILGILVAINTHQAMYTSGEKLVLTNLANLATSAIHYAGRLTEIQRDLKRKEEELNQLRRAGLLISSRMQLEETLVVILQMALEITNAQYGIFRLVDKTGKQMITRAVAGDSLNRPLVDVLPVEPNSVMGWAACNRQAVCIGDLRDKPWKEIYYPLDLGLEMRSELAIPLISASGRLEGVLNLESPRVNAFSDQDRRLLQSLATQAVIAIQEVRLLDVVQEAAHLILTQPYPKTLGKLVGMAADLLNGDSSGVWILRGSQLQLQAAWGNPKPADRLSLDDSLAGEVIEKRAPLAVNGSSQWHYADFAAADTSVSALEVPLMIGGTRNPVGVMGVFSASPETSHFASSEWDKKVLTCLAYYAALAVQYAAHQEALRAEQDQRAVAETFAVVGDIAANVLHNLNNKVGTIPVRIQGIRDKCEGTLKKDAYLNGNLAEIERSANEAMESVRENLSQLRPITLAEVSVDVCVRQAIESARLPGGIKIQVDPLDYLPPVMAAERSLSLVFANLLGNAAEAMGGEGEIFLSGFSDEDWVEVTVHDTGPGIPPELHERIFELNYSNRGQTQGSKLGFGLWWVKTLLARLGGTVSVESDGANGAAFHVRLPGSKVRR